MLRPALLALCLLTLPAAAAEPPVLTLGESAERAIQQDRLTVALRAEATGPTAAGVQAEINRRMEAAVARARQSAGVSVETGAYWTHEERPQNQPRRWRGAATLELSGSDMAALTSPGPCRKAAWRCRAYVSICAARPRARPRTS